MVEKLVLAALPTHRSVAGGVERIEERLLLIGWKLADDFANDSSQAGARFAHDQNHAPRVFADMEPHPVD